MQEVRVTLAVAAVLRAFLSDPGRERYGYDLMRETGFPSGKLYPILARLTRAGWLERRDPSNRGAQDEDGAFKATPGGPPRITYKMAPNALPVAQAQMRDARRALSVS